MPALVTTGPSILSSSAFAAAFIWLSLALGRRLLRWLGLREHDSLAEYAVIALALGAGALQFIPLALGAAGLLRVSTLRLAVGATALALFADLHSVARAAWHAHWRRPPNWLVACAVALLPTLAITTLLAVTPTIDPDGLGYHLTVPKRWLESGTLGYLPTYPYSNTPMGFELLFSIAMAFAGDAAAKTLHFACGIAGALGLYLAGKRLRGELIGAIAAVLYLVGPVGVGAVLGCAYLEGATTLAMVASTLAWLLWLRERKAAWLRCAFALAGVGVTFKITAALFPIALGALTLAALGDPAQRKKDEPLVRALRPAWQLIPFVALPVAPWLLRSAVLTGNPFFPLFARWIPSRDLSPALAKQFEDYNRYMLWASRLGASWSLEQRKLVLACVGLAALLLAGLAFFRARSHLARAVASVLALTVLVQLGAVGLYVRYWIPSLAVLELPLLLLLPSVPAISERWAQRLLVAAAALGAVLQARQGLGSVSRDLGGLARTAFGLQSQQSFLERHLPLFPLYQQANQTLPPDAKIVLSTYCGGFYLDRTTYCAEFVQDSLRFTGWSPFMTDIHRLGVTHVIAPTKLATEPVVAAPIATGSVLPGGGSVSEIYRAQQNEYVGRLLNDHGKLLATAADQSLYAVELSHGEAR